MKKILLSLLLIPLFTFAETTGNLLNQNFNTSDWSGTNKSTRHGNGTIAGVHGKYVESTISLSDTLTESQINNGWTSTLGADIWHWNNLNSTTTMKQTITDADGTVTTQIREVDLTGCGSINCGSYSTYTDSYTQGINQKSDYDIAVRFSFEESSQSSSHYGTDLKNPTLTIEHSLITAEQATTLSEISETVDEIIETEVETIEFEPLEEYTFEVFEEPEVVFEILEEIYFVPTATEEINTGIVDIFFEAIETEEIELTELPTIENFEETNIVITEEPSIFEETVELIEEMFEEIPTEEKVVTSTTEGSVEESSFQEEVADDTQTEQEVATSVEEEETLTARNETISETSETQESTGTDDGTVSSESGEGTDREFNETTSGTEEVATDSSQREVPATLSINVADVSDKVAQKIKDVGKQLQATQMIVARAMQNNDAVNSYSQINNQIFNNQIIIDGGNLDEYMQRNYLDTRVLYAESSIGYKDSLQLYQDRIDEAVANRIRAEEHLRRIRGF